MSGWLLFWLALTLLFAAGEALGRTLRIAPFAVAAMASAGAAYGGASVALQWTIYAVASAVLSIAAMIAARRLRV